MKKTKWTSALEQHLRDQAITTDQPGPVLKDFGLILDYLGTQGVKSAGKYNLLPLSCIPELNPHLSRPLSLELRRPQLRSHPYLQGLNLLLRASGLGRVEGVGAKARLTLDPVMLEQWNRLNPTEQYFNLLEAWWLFGRAEMVGEKDRLRGPMLSSCFQACWFLSENTRQLEANEAQYISLIGIDRAFYQLALLDLFGIMAVEQPPSGGTSWIPASIRLTPFGSALMALLDTKIEPFSGYLRSDAEDEENEDEENEEEEEEEEEDTGLDEPWFGAWQSVFQPYFPEWRENLVFPKREPREGTYLFRVSLGTIWRQIAMPADATLDDLVGWILRSVNFDSDHLYMFTYRDQLGTKVSAHHPASDEGPWADAIPIGLLPLEPGQTMDLLYDFGDSWRFTIKLEKIESPTATAKVKAPRIVKRHGKAPEQYPSWDD